MGMPILIKKSDNKSGIGIAFPNTIISPMYIIENVILKVSIQKTHKPILEDTSDILSCFHLALQYEH